MDRANTWKRTIYLLLLLVMTVLAISSFFVAQRKLFDPSREEGLRQIEPISIVEKEDGTTEYEFEFKYLTRSTRNLLFYTNHQEVSVYMNNTLIYASLKSDSIFGHTTGAVWNQIGLPEVDGTMKVLIKPVYPEIRQDNCEFYQGHGVAMGYVIIIRSLPAMLVCLMILVSGICILCFWAFSGMNHRSSLEMLYLGMLSLFIGIWALGETQGVVYLLRNRVAPSYMAYTCLMAVGLLFTMFTRRFMHLQNNYLFDIIMGYGFVEIVVSEALQFLNIYDMKQTFTLTHILLAASILYVFYGVVVNLRRHCYLRRTLVIVIGFVVLSITMSMDVYAYYNSRINANRFGKFGVMIYILLVSLESLRELKQRMQEETQLQIYREMAIKDMLTGCYNRNAYDEAVEQEKDVRWSQVVMFDLNNLKHCNDYYGHQSGDKYLCDSAAIIRQVYERYGRVYRMGGDEFCVITHGLSEKKLSDLRSRLENAQREYNHQDPETSVGIACGYAVYDEAVDKTIEDIRLRADAQMYENKRDLKGKK